MKKQFCKPPENCLWIAGLIFALALLLLGLFQGQEMGVWNKAVRICMECIGIG